MSMADTSSVVDTDDEEMMAPLEEVEVTDNAADDNNDGAGGKDNGTGKEQVKKGGVKKTAGTKTGGVKKIGGKKAAGTKAAGTKKAAGSKDEASTSEAAKPKAVKTTKKKQLTTKKDIKPGGKTALAKRSTKSQRAGIFFPVKKTINKLRKFCPKGRISPIAGVYLASTLEYLVAEVVELAGNAARDLKKKRLVPRHLYLAFRGDDELDQLFKNVTLAGGGVIPHIHKSLLGNKSETMEKTAPAKSK